MAAESGMADVGMTGSSPEYDDDGMVGVIVGEPKLNCERVGIFLFSLVNPSYL